MLNERLAAAEDNAGQLKTLADEQSRQVEDLMAKVERLEKQVATGQTGPADSPAAAAPDGQTVAGQPPAAAQDQGGPGAFLKMFEGEQGKKFAEVSAESNVNMQYAELLEMLALPAESEQKVRDILRDFAVRQIQASVEFMRDGADPEKGKKAQEQMKADLRKELEQVLNATGMAMFDEYEEGMGERMLRKSLDMQIGMFAPSLTAENRTVAVDVLVEEMMAAGHPNDMSMMNSPESAQGMLDALQRGRDRLNTVLDEQQMSQVDRLIQQQRSSLEMFQQLMSKKPLEAAPSPPPAEKR